MTYLLIRDGKPVEVESTVGLKIQGGDILIDTDAMEYTVDGENFCIIPCQPYLPADSTRVYVEAYSRTTDLVQTTFVIDGEKVVV
jgi:hypothetical protein